MKALLLWNNSLSKEKTNLIEGLLTLNYDIVHQNNKGWNIKDSLNDVNMVIINGYQHSIIEHYKSLNIPVLVNDLGYILRPHYNQLGLNQSNYMFKEPDYNRMNSLNIELSKAPTINKGEYILILGQKDGGKQHDISNFNKYIEFLVSNIKSFTNRPICIRYHPDSGKVNNNSLQEDIEGAYCVVSYNSTALYEVIMKGKPFIALDKNSIFAEYVSPDTLKDIDNIKVLPLVQRKEIMGRICRSIFSLEEYQNGYAISTMLTKNKKD